MVVVIKKQVELKGEKVVIELKEVLWCAWDHLVQTREHLHLTAGV